MARVVLPLLFVLFLITAASAQIFSRMTESPVVTDGGSSASVSFIDTDNDGDLDLFITNDEETQGNFYYLNDGTGNFSVAAVDTIVETGGHNVGASWGDFDNDGDADCFVARWSNQSNKLYINLGDGTFGRGNVPPVTNSGGYSETGSWADYDNNGWLDLFVTNSAGNNHHNWLYRSNGDGSFNSMLIAPISTDGDDSRSAGWCDFNSDGHSDIFVANENADNDALYVSNGDGTFTRWTGTYPGVDGANNFTSSWGDIDNDGDFDLFVGSYGSQSLLYRNHGGEFQWITGSPVSSDNQQAVGSAFGDYDNDGDLDLLVTNGFAASGNIYRHNYLYDNDGAGNFTRASVEPIEADSGWGFGCAFGDIDGDQDLDLCIARSRNADEDNLLYRNTQTENNGIVLKLRGTSSNKSAIGAVVSCWANGRQIRQVEGQTGYCGQTLDLHFGLGQETTVDSIVVKWPAGSIEVFPNLSASTTYVITQGEGAVSVDERETPMVENQLLLKSFPNPFNASVSLETVLPARGLTKVEIFNTLGQSVATLHDGMAGPGTLALTWQPSGLASGMYLVTATQGQLSDTQSVQFIK
ncbi:VCBS repeat-containing protein [bacterium]|nr:VCBS repeat-containing protein [bacterium]